jgi:hypothetical protein
MKKIAIFFILMILCATAVACTADPLEPSTQDVDTLTVETITTQSASTVKALPVYVPGSIKLVPKEYLDEFSFPVTKREVYYSISGAFEILAYPEAADEIFNGYKTNGIEPTEMRLVTFVKHFNISRKDFEKALEAERKRRIDVGFDISDEQYELPNADIIYTFDNEIINEYYRRE